MTFRFATPETLRAPWPPYTFVGHAYSITQDNGLTAVLVETPWGEPLWADEVTGSVQLFMDLEEAQRAATAYFAERFHKVAHSVMEHANGTVSGKVDGFVVAIAADDWKGE